MAVNKNFIVKRGLEVQDSAVINGILVASGLKYPSQDGTANDVIKTDGSGNLSLGKLQMNNLSDVDMQSLENGGLLIYDSASEKWIAGNDLVQQDINSDGGFY
jgi:hypothetical protein